MTTPDIRKMHDTWESLKVSTRNPTELSNLNFDEIISSVFSIGQFYYYVIDFYDMSISHISSGFEESHGIDSEKIKDINDILSLIHPDDIDFVSKAEKKALSYIYTILGPQKFLTYKASYNFRFKTTDGSYRLYNHQSLILTLDENNNFVKSLNIHTDISHLTSKNNYKCSLIGLKGESSFLNMEVEEDFNAIEKKMFSKREIEIILMISKGLTTKQISEQLFISIDTVKFHRSNILAKANCTNVAELIARSISEGWV